MDTFTSGFLMMMLGAVGLIPVIFVVLQLLIFRPNLLPFHYLILSKLAADGLTMLVAIMALSASQLLFGQWLSKQKQPIVGYLALSLQFSSFYTCVASTVNRLLAISCPVRYNNWCGRKQTLFWIIACWLIAWAHNIILLKDGARHSDTKFVPEDCSFTFNAGTRQLAFSPEPCGRVLSLYVDLIYNLVTAIITLLADVYCVVRLVHSERVSIQSSMGSCMPSLVSTSSSIFFCNQTIANSVLYVFMLICFQIGHCINNHTVGFLLTVIAWQLWLVTAPYIIVFSEREFQKPLCKLLMKKEGRSLSNAVPISIVQIS